jgi:hypothetical protein
MLPTGPFAMRDRTRAYMHRDRNPELVHGGVAIAQRAGIKGSSR